MSFDLSARNEARTIRDAQFHRRVGSACSEIVVSLALIISICTIALMIGTNAASAGVRNLVMVDDGIGGGSAIFAIIGVVVLFMLLAPFAFNGLTPGHVRRRRARR